MRVVGTGLLRVGGWFWATMPVTISKRISVVNILVLLPVVFNGVDYLMGGEMFDWIRFINRSKKVM
jgi:hypothetical protein